MDPISTTIIAAVTAGVTSGITDAGKKAMVDSYNVLKDLIKKKIGRDSKVSKAIHELEEEPDSDAQQKLLIERMAKTDVDQDQKIVQAAHELMEQLKKAPDGEKYIMYAKGTGIAQADRGGSATVTINKE